MCLLASQIQPDTVTLDDPMNKTRLKYRAFIGVVRHGLLEKYRSFHFYRQLAGSCYRQSSHAIEVVSNRLNSKSATKKPIIW